MSKKKRQLSACLCGGGSATGNEGSATGNEGGATGEGREKRCGLLGSGRAAGALSGLFAGGTACLSDERRAAAAAEERA